MDKLKKLKELFTKKNTEPGLELDISEAENEEDFWNAAWDSHKLQISEQFMQSMVMDTEELAVPIPFLTDANHYELSATVTQSMYPETLPSGKVVNKFIVKPSLYTLATKNLDETVHQFKVHEESLESRPGIIAARYGDFKEGDCYEVIFSFYNPRIYSMPSNLIGVTLDLDPEDFLDGTELYVVDKVWVCDKLTGSLAVKLEQTSIEMQYLSVAGSALNPHYGVPICFSVTKYPLDTFSVIQPPVEISQAEIRDTPWEKKGERTHEPQDLPDESEGTDSGMLITLPEQGSSSA